MAKTPTPNPPRQPNQPQRRRAIANQPAAVPSPANPPPRHRQSTRRRHSRPRPVIPAKAVIQPQPHTALAASPQWAAALADGEALITE